LSWQPQRVSVVSLMYIYFDIWSISKIFFGNSMHFGSFTPTILIFATIVLSYSKSALSTTAGVLAVLPSDSSSLAYWNLRWTVLKSYILSIVYFDNCCQTKNWLLWRHMYISTTIIKLYYNYEMTTLMTVCFDNTCRFWWLSSNRTIMMTWFLFLWQYFDNYR